MTEQAVLESPHPEYVKELMAKYAHEGVTNKPVLMSDLMELNRIRNSGYPLWMYHATALPQMVINQGQMEALRTIGYRPQIYIHHDFPAMFLRRNMDPKFAESPLGEHIEGFTAKDQAALDAAQKARKPKTVVGGWVATVAELPEIEDGPAEDPKVTIARLEGELKSQRERAGVPTEAKSAKTKAA